MEIISMTCRQCGGSLKISKDADQIICQHCGTEYLISFNEGAVSVKLLSEGLKKIQVSTDKTASELALARLNKEKEDLLTKMRNKVINPYSALPSTSYSEKQILNNLLLEPKKLQTYLSRELAKEKNKNFILRNDYKVNNLESGLHVLSGILQRYEEITTDENYHINQVKSK